MIFNNWRGPTLYLSPIYIDLRSSPYTLFVCAGYQSLYSISRTN
eukprot:UN00288